MAKTNRISINFKLPEDLLEEARAFATENETTLTALVIEGLRCVLDSTPGTDNGTDDYLHQQQLVNLKDTVQTLDTEHSKRIEQLEAKVEQLTQALIQLKVNASTPNRRSKSPYPHNQPPAQILPFEEENLARRLVIDIKTLRHNRETMTQSEFLSWSKNRDPSEYSWKYNVKDNLYHPFK
ncbi:MAG: hypothetical protein KME29_09595 [Calothrix sp. FI2-JRJ7]|jgi:hypothetical protein|nr:hypothetical protein [Calothrix sp. FI2-JRJ7]